MHGEQARVHLLGLFAAGLARTALGPRAPLGPRTALAARAALARGSLLAPARATGDEAALEALAVALLAQARAQLGVEVRQELLVALEEDRQPHAELVLGPAQVVAVDGLHGVLVGQLVGEILDRVLDGHSIGLRLLE